MKATTEFCPPTPSMGSQEHPRDRNNPAETHVGNGRHVGRKRRVEPVRLGGNSSKHQLVGDFNPSEKYESQLR